MAPRSRMESDAIRAASRDRIVAAAAELIADNGFAACRVADVARRAGMSPGNLYWHFDSKEAILRAILAEGFAATDAMADEVAAAYGPARRKLELLVDRTIALHEAQGAFFVILGGLRGRGGRDLVRSLGFDLPAIEARHRASLRRVFAEARSEGVIGPVDPDVLVSLHLAFFDGLAIARRADPTALSEEVRREAVLRLAGHRAIR